MYLKIIFNAALFFILVVFQLAFVSGLPGWLPYLNLILVTLIFILVLSGVNAALWWAAAIGLFLDSFSFLHFGVYFASFGLTIAAANLVLVNFLTNRSLYSFLALAVFSTLFYELFFRFLSRLSSLILGKENFFPFDFNFAFSLAKELGLNILLVSLIFYLLNFASDKLKPVFLVRK